MHDITLDGQGSDFLYRGRMTAIAVLNSRNISLKDFSIDYENPMMAQLEVIENNGQSLKFKPASWVRWRIKGGKFNYYGQGWDYDPWLAVAFDKNKKNLLYKTADIGVNINGAIDNGDGSVTAPNWKNPQLVVGSRIAARTGDKQCPGIFLQKNKDTQLSKVNIHYSQAMALLAHACENVSLDQTSVKIREGSGRYFTAQADATHFSCCKGKISVKNGLFEGMMDDALNVHGLYLLVSKRVNKHTVEAHYPEVQSWGFEWGLKGEKAQFIASNTFDSIGSTYTIKSIKPKDKATVLGAKVFTLEFEEELPQEINEHKKIGIENLTRTASVDYLNNTVRNNRARGILLNTPQHVLVEGNTFDHVSGSAILSSTDCNGWYESGRIQDLIIRNNKFIDCLTTNGFQFCEAIISFNPIIPNAEAQKEPFYGRKDGIIIENNLFNTFDTPLLYAGSTKGIVWRNNTIKESKSYPKYHPNKRRFNLEYSKDIRVDGKLIGSDEDRYTGDEYSVWNEVFYPRYGTGKVIQALQVKGATKYKEPTTFDLEVAGYKAQRQEKIYFDKTTETLDASLGDKLIVKPIQNGLSWMHYFLFIDYNQNKQFDEDELVSFTGYQAPEDIEADIYRNSLGEQVSPSAVPNEMPAFTIPESAKIGKTRARFKVDWSSKDPRGSAKGAEAIDKLSGTICDFSINIHGEKPVALEELSAKSLEVYTNNEQVIIKGAKNGSIAQLYNAEGLRLKSFQINSDPYTFQLNKTYSFYFLKLENKAFKLIL